MSARFRSLSLALTALAVGLPLTAHAQPAGPRLWLRADAGVVADGGTGKVSSWTDQSGNGLVATQAAVNAQPVLVAGAINGRPALRFDGASDGAQDFLGNTTVDLAPGGTPNTVIMVGQAAAASNGGTFISYRRTASVIVYSLGFVNGQFFVYTDGVNSPGNASIPDLRSTIRTPFISTHRSAGPGNKVEVRVNGTQQPVTQPGAVSTEAGATGFLVGGRLDTSPNFFPWQGDIAELLVYDRALTVAEQEQAEAYLSNKYGAATSIIEEDLAGHYPFTGNANDASGNGHHGTVNGATLTTDRDGVANRAYAFNGTGARITLPAAPSLKRFNQSFTISARVRPVSSANTVHTIISNRINIPGDVAGSRFDIVDGAVGSRRLNFTVKGGVTAQTISGTSDVPYDTWSHVAITFEHTGTGTNTVRLYLNGVLNGSGTTGNILDPGTHPNTLGGEPNTSVASIARFAGAMDEVRLYGRALSQPELAALTASDAPLPVELSGFIGRSSAGRVELAWQTSSETDNAGFSLIRDGVEIASYRTSPALAGRGTTAQRTSYTFTDGAVALGRTYSYRLRSTDRSGEIHDYPATVAVTVVETPTVDPSLPTEFTLHPASPNPFNPTTTLRFSLPEAAQVTIQIYNGLGQLIASPVTGRAFAAGSGAEVTFDGAGLSSGVYLVRLTAIGASGAVNHQAQRVLLAK